ncbi:tetratricopeptide repeat protein [Sphaerisporangium rubeum]|uniref:Tetratricopeptide (TPR) repeat protein n=1 Tax=Sphaerisporangium rubeum TaxID=321317 RepID=A0A7X0IDB5_9ACTN|nr:tetratricopeptide repeat protein [Sphaerisporangium rubeum]MBB6473156.1 tetratricopeptide (TPR) repeat protein [Sphaerisporangium rubeum]
MGHKSCAALLSGWVAWTRFAGADDDWTAPRPASSIMEARLLVIDAVGRLLAFLDGETILFRELLHAMTDVTDAQVGRLHRDAVMQPIIRAARQGRCAVLAEALVPVLTGAQYPVQALTAREVRQDAEMLSDLIIRTCLDTVGCPVRPDAVWGFWFQQCVVGRAGPAAEERERAEHELRAGERQGPPLTRLARSLLAGAQDLPAATATFAKAAKRSASLGHWGEACDSLSRAGLAALRYGDWAQAGSRLREAEDLGRAHLGQDDPRVARALSGQAELLARSGRPDHALSMITRVLDTRTRDTGPAGPGRVRTIERVRAAAYAEYGRVTRAVELAGLLADGSPEPADLVLHAAVLRQAGHPSAALRCLDRAARMDEVAFGLECHTERARCELDLDRPAAALRVLLPLTDNWRRYATHVSVRATFHMLILTALASGSADALAAHRDEARGRPVFEHDDPLFDDFGWAMARLLRNRGDVAAAVEELIQVAESQERRVADGRLFPMHPCVATTHLELGECAEAAGDPAGEAARRYDRVIGDAALDAAHPLRIAAVLGRARVARHAGDHATATRLVATLPPVELLDPDLELAEEATRLLRIYGDPDGGRSGTP